MTGPDNVHKALAKSVDQLDASRRVGWAKYHELETRQGDILRDLNMARSDIEIYRRALSRALGAVAGAFGERDFDGVLSQVVGYNSSLAIQHALDETELVHGFNTGEFVMGRKKRTSRSKQDNNARKVLAVRLGFKSVDELVRFVKMAQKWTEL